MNTPLTDDQVIEFAVLCMNQDRRVTTRKLLAEYRETLAARAQAAPEPSPCRALGIKADGSVHDLGPIPEVLMPKPKMRKIVCSYFGGFTEGDDSDADTCMIAMEEFQRWYKAGLDALSTSHEGST
jgi:hypothetical protein